MKPYKPYKYKGKNKPKKEAKKVNFSLYLQ